MHDIRSKIYHLKISRCALFKKHNHPNNTMLCDTKVECICCVLGAQQSNKYAFSLSIRWERAVF